MDSQPDPQPDEVADPDLRSANVYARTVYGPHGATDRLRVTVLDANGTAVANGDAILQRDDGLDGPTYTIRYTDLVLVRDGDAVLGGRVLPVRAQRQPDSVTYRDPGNAATFSDTASPIATLSANYGPLSHPHSITHGHVHSHPTSPLAQPTSYDHAHRHTHYGDYAHRANAFGHTNDSHGDHAH